MVTYGKWFPVRVNSPDKIQQLKVEVMKPYYYYGDNPKKNNVQAIYRAAPGKNRVSCRITDDNCPVICKWTTADGLEHSCFLRPLINNDANFILVVSDQPQAFDFLSGIRIDDYIECRWAEATANNFPEHWRDLEGIDAIILDGATKKIFSPAQKTAFKHWLAAGGTVYITPNALKMGAKGTWDLYPGVTVAPKSTPVTVPSLQNLIPKFSDYLKKVPSVDLHVPPLERVIYSPKDTLIGARDTGNGRVVVLGMDLNELKIDERIVFEGLRKELWTKLLVLIRPETSDLLRNNLIIPQEAKARYLAWHIIIFLAAYVIALGLVNWLVLRGFKRFEYSIITLPIGALLFAVIAFGTGLKLRGNKTIINEVKLTLSQNSGIAYAYETTGILSPDRKPFTFSTDPFSLINVAEGRQRNRYGHNRYGNTKPLEEYKFGETTDIKDVKVGTWTMAFLNTKSTDNLGKGLEISTAFSGSNLVGKIKGSLPFVLKDAHIIYRWHRQCLGDLGPEVDIEFSMPLIAETDLKSTRCPNCGGFHHGGWFSEEFAEKYPLSESLREILNETSGRARPEEPFLAGHPVQTNRLIGVNRTETIESQKQICVFPSQLSTRGPDLAIPYGIISERDLEYEEMNSFEYVNDINYQYMPEILKKLGLDKKDDTNTRMDYHFQTTRERLIIYRLPTSTTQWDPTHIGFLWIFDEDDYEEKENPAPFPKLLTYDWEKGNWQEIHTAHNGTNEVTLANPEQFISETSGTLAVKLKTENIENPNQYRSGALHMTWHARESKEK
ncbi:hypothetical protein ACFLS1_01760 [Verrucomicrobiota bacterium]